MSNFEDANKLMVKYLNDFNIKKQYPNLEQRIEACINLVIKNTKMSFVHAADFKFCFEEFGFEEEINENNLYIPQQSEYVTSEEVEFNENEVIEHDFAGNKPGLWDNIRKKKEREGKNYRPAKPGDKDRPSKEAWKLAQSSEGEMAKQQIEKMHMQLMQLVEKMKTMEIEFEEWTTDMISKSELYVQNIYDFAMSYEPEMEDEDEMENEDEMEDETEDESEANEYQGRKVKLNRPFRTPGGPKKFAVYVKNKQGNIIIVRFGQPGVKIKKDNPDRRRSFRARHNCDTAKDKTTPRYWSCKMW